VHKLLSIVLALALVTFAASPASADTSAADARAAVPSDVTVAFAVFDRDSGRTTLRYNEHQQIRSASVVKLLIALDYFETNGPDTPIPDADLALLVPMLRSSDDDAASELWVRLGWEKIVERAVTRLRLVDSAPPVNVGFWGYTALSAADVVTIYRHVLEDAPVRVRDFIMGNLYAATTCATDGFDQSFGIPSAIPGRVAFKQGWSRFGDVPPRPCVEPEPHRFTGASKDGDERSLTPDLTRPAMHTTGVYGDKIMAVLTLEPEGTTWDQSAQRITVLTKAVYLAERIIGGHAV
jgi:hypothetical protein